MKQKLPSLNLRNIGPASEQWLRAVGIHSRSDLERMGAAEAFHLIRQHGFRASLNLLYALEGALHDEHWNDLSVEIKAKLKAAAQS